LLRKKSDVFANACKLIGARFNVIKLSQIFCLSWVGGELANPNSIGNVGVCKLATNLRYIVIC